MATVLIVDDSPTEVHVLKTWLEKNGFMTLTAESGEEGIQKARNQKPDAIIMDVIMPGMSGFQATRQLTKDPETSGIPIVMVTTKGQETDKIWGMRQGAVAYLPKPVTEKQVVGKMHEVLNAFVFSSIAEVRELTNSWLTTYNTQRPHDSLGRVPPLTFLPRLTNPQTVQL